MSPDEQKWRVLMDGAKAGARQFQRSAGRKGIIPADAVSLRKWAGKLNGYSGQCEVAIRKRWPADRKLDGIQRSVSEVIHAAEGLERARGWR